MSLSEHRLRWFDLSMTAVTASLPYGAVAAFPVILQIMMDLTRADLAMIFACERDSVKFVTGREPNGRRINLPDVAPGWIPTDTIVRSLMSNAEYIVSELMSAFESEEHSRTVICIPLGLKRASLESSRVLYLDVTSRRSEISLDDYDLLRTLASDVAYLCDSYQEVLKWEMPCRELLEFSDTIRIKLAVRIPAVDFGHVSVHSASGSRTLRDVYDIVADDDSVAVLEPKIPPPVWTSGQYCSVTRSKR